MGNGHGWIGRGDHGWRRWIFDLGRHGWRLGPGGKGRRDGSTRRGASRDPLRYRRPNAPDGPGRGFRSQVGEEHAGELVNQRLAARRSRTEGR